MQPVLFLDFDDVLIVPTVYKIKHRRRALDGRKVDYAFAPIARDLLLSLARNIPKCSFVISSTWRFEGRKEVETVLRLNGCRELIERLHSDWRTGVENLDSSRADEIAGWLSRHPEVGNVAAIDNDESIVGKPWGVWVDPAFGLTEAHISAAVRLLF